MAHGPGGSCRAARYIVRFLDEAMHLVSINIAKAQPIHSKSGMSGIFK